MITSLQPKFTNYFVEQKESLINNLFITTEAVFMAKTPNLNKAKDYVGTILNNQLTTTVDSNYTRLIRFFDEAALNHQELTRSLLLIVFCILKPKKNKKPLYLILDGTSWELGCTKVHLLTLSIVINEVAVPIIWEDLEKKGISNIEERKALFESACEWYDLEGMLLLADREYIGEEWFKYLKSKKIDFVIRLRKAIYKKCVDEQRSGVSNCFKHQKCTYSAMEHQAMMPMYKNTGVSKQVEILGELYSFVIFKNPKTEGVKKEDTLIYYLSTLNNKAKIIALYPTRWKIECCFKHLKTNGFNLEEVNLGTSEKIKMMMAILVFLYAICIDQGLKEFEKCSKKSAFKKYKNGKITLSRSVFRTGLAIVQGKFTNLQGFFTFLINLLHHARTPVWVHV